MNLEEKIDDLYDKAVEGISLIGICMQVFR